MVGIVIVSHSYKVAEGIKDILDQMAQKSVPIATAGGTSDLDIGTDPFKIKDAIEEVYSEDGVIIFIDIGSAIMNTKIAIEFLDDEMQSNIVIANAPVLEGGLVAAVESKIGRDLMSIKESVEQSVKEIDKFMD
ncbi:dihydroxyacetone kinase phosphoryl donor subunit DhaM [Abyssisolibacter fermentans]|uniref:dihydroxyacetone kinase phosphoryl donor subunit DhaM n=1 Tax=Abyssisolibacter fermentans TaxID=1766203 RepID=UPI00082AF5DF|nr:dihydroxyacetone kinase phosphoryl donor subunit DhaM [Abyssisolibacter fermentans]